MRLLLIVVLLVLLGAAWSRTAAARDERPPLRSSLHLDLDRYMGRWWVIGHIPYFAERGKVATADIYALRIGNVVSPEDYANFPGYLAEPLSRKRNAWSYIDARDLGQIVDRCIAVDGLGFQVFNAVNDTITALEPTRDFLAKWAPHTPITRDLDGFEAPISNRKIRDLLGFVEEHNWRNYVKAG